MVISASYRWRRYVVATTISLLGVGVIIFYALTAGASGSGWADGGMIEVYDSRTITADETNSALEDCSEVGIFSSTVCLSEGSVVSAGSTEGGAVYVQYPEEGELRRVFNVSNLYLIPHTDTALVMHSNGRGISVIDNFSSRIQLMFPGHDRYGDLLELGSADLPHVFSSNNSSVGVAGYSPNGDFIVYGKRLYSREPIGTFVLVDVKSKAARYIKVPSDMSLSWQSDSAVTVSNDGRYVASASHNNIHIWKTDECSEGDPGEDCRVGTINSDRFGEGGVSTSGGFSRITFNGDGQKLSFDYRISNETYRSITIGLSVREPHHLDYLALGDSYSSGEGDIGKKDNGGSYYLSGTEERGGCHVSERSYPFLLRDHFGATSDSMKSVACSGAQVVMDYIAPLKTYPGQGGRLSKLTVHERAGAQEEAVMKFKPGYVPQLEFVQRYKPRVITLTGGGNDVGFANILKYCATPTPEGLVVDDTCGYAIKGSHLEGVLYSSIETQYTYTKMLLDRIKTLSPGSDVIIVGYPSFIAEGSMLPCGLNGVKLNNKERDMINSAVRHLNKVLKRAAFDARVKFADIEDSLVGGRICESGRYMTGLLELGINRVIDEDIAEAFHPNAAGHRQMAEFIKASAAVPSERPSYKSKSVGHTSLSKQIIDSGIILSSQSTKTIRLLPGALMPGSIAKLTAFSDEMDLGSTIVNDDGSVSAEISVESIPIGLHVLVVSGQAYSGEAVDYYQFIEVKDEASGKSTSRIGEENDNKLESDDGSKRQEAGVQVTRHDGEVSLMVASNAKTDDHNGETLSADTAKSNQINNRNRGGTINYNYLVTALAVVVITGGLYVGIKFKKQK